MWCFKMSLYTRCCTCLFGNIVHLGTKYSKFSIALVPTTHFIRSVIAWKNCFFYNLLSILKSSYFLSLTSISRHEVFNIRISNWKMKHTFCWDVLTQRDSRATGLNCNIIIFKIKIKQTPCISVGYIFLHHIYPRCKPFAVITSTTNTFSSSTFTSTSFT